MARVLADTISGAVNWRVNKQACYLIQPQTPSTARYWPRKGSLVQAALQALLPAANKAPTFCVQAQACRHILGHYTLAGYSIPCCPVWSDSTAHLPSALHHPVALAQWVLAGPVHSFCQWASRATARSSRMVFIKFCPSLRCKLCWLREAIDQHILCWLDFMTPICFAGLNSFPQNIKKLNTKWPKSVIEHESLLSLQN